MEQKWFFGTKNSKKAAVAAFELQIVGNNEFWATYKKVFWAKIKDSERILPPSEHCRANTAGRPNDGAFGPISDERWASEHCNPSEFCE